MKNAGARAVAVARVRQGASAIRRAASHGDMYMPKKTLRKTLPRLLSPLSASLARDWHAGERCGCERGKGK
jgi:ribosomal protein L14